MEQQNDRRSGPQPVEIAHENTERRIDCLGQDQALHYHEGDPRGYNLRDQSQILRNGRSLGAMNTMVKARDASDLNFDHESVESPAEMVSPSLRNDIEPIGRDNDGELATIEPIPIGRSTRPLRVRNRNLLQSIRSYLSPDSGAEGKHATSTTHTVNRSQNSTTVDEDRNFTNIRPESDSASDIPSLLLRMSDPAQRLLPPHLSPPSAPSIQLEAAGSKPTTIQSDITEHSITKTQTQSTYRRTSTAPAQIQNGIGENYH